jgi:thiol-disulfide isomerase/thioredoxin
MVVERCPKCGYEIPEARQGGTDCARCGVVFDRYDPDRTAMRPMARVSRPEAAPRSPLLLLAAIAAGAIVLLLLIPGRRERSAEPPTPPVPDSASAPSTGGAIPVADDAPGLTAADLLARPGLDSFGEASPDRARSPLTDGQLAEAREALAGEDGLRVEVVPLDPATGQGMSAMRPDGASDPTPEQEEAAPLSWIGWYEGAGGYEDALRQMDRMRPRPLIVYFHADWCGYCRRFESDFLPDPLTRRFLSDVFRVHVNPERSDEDLALARRFGIQGYPSFMILRPGEFPEQARRVHPFFDNQTIPVTQFVSMCEEAAGL